MGEGSPRDFTQSPPVKVSFLWFFLFFSRKKRKNGGKQGKAGAFGTDCPMVFAHFLSPPNGKRMMGEGSPRDFTQSPSLLRFLFFGSFFSFPRKKRKNEKPTQKGIRHMQQSAGPAMEGAQRGRLFARRPLCLAALGALLGLLLYAALERAQALPALLALPALTLAAAVYRRGALAALVPACLVCLSALLQCPSAPAAAEGLLTGRIAEPPAAERGRQVLLLDAAAVDGEPVRGRVELTVYGAAPLSYGQRVAVQASLRTAEPGLASFTTGTGAWPAARARRGCRAWRRDEGTPMACCWRCARRSPNGSGCCSRRARRRRRRAASCSAAALRTWTRGRRHSSARWASRICWPYRACTWACWRAR